MRHTKLTFFMILVLAMSFIGANSYDDFTQLTAGIEVHNNGIHTIAIGEHKSVSAFVADGDNQDYHIATEDMISFAWTIVGPTGSAVTLDSLTIIDPTFVPDLVGEYTLTVVISTSDGALAPATLTLSAGTYVGVGTINDADADYETGQCGYACHAEKVTLWETTEHSDAFEVKFDAFSSYCYKCHTVGGFLDDATIDNGGFISTLGDDTVPGTLDSLRSELPDLTQLESIQCENCHGAGSEHKGATGDNEISNGRGVNTCLPCHGDGHGIENWQYSEHGSNSMDNPEQFRMYSAGGDPTSHYGDCEPCHTGEGFRMSQDDDYAGLMPEKTTIGCADCHDPHYESKESADGSGFEDTNHQLRGLTGVTLNDMPVTGDHGERDGATVITAEEAGLGAMCMNCHKARADVYTNAKGRSRVGPHHSPHADMLMGTNGIIFGVEEKSSAAHVTGLENTCVDCHMQTVLPSRYGDDYLADVQATFGLAAVPSSELAAELATKAVNHSFYNTVTIDDVRYDNVKGCVGCHSGIKSFADINWTGFTDQDGDGDNTEGFMAEIDGMMEDLEARLDALDANEKTSPMNVVYAIYNWEMVLEDKSLGAHNPQYTLTLINSANALLDAGDIIAEAEEIVVADVPMDQGKQVRVTWMMFEGDPDMVKTYAIWRKVDDVVAAKRSASVEVADFGAMYEMYKNTGSTMYKVGASEYDFVGEVPASGMPYYSTVAATLYDGVESSFAVSGHSAMFDAVFTADGVGTSTDDLAPAAPAGVAAKNSWAKVELSWDDAIDADFKYVAVYRGDAGFTPSDANRVGYATEARFVEEGLTAGSYVYMLSAFDFAGNESDFSTIEVEVTSIGDDQFVPGEFKLAQNYPNPFNPTTVIEYQLAKAADVKLTIYNVLGQQVALLASGTQAAGLQRVTWDARDTRGNVVAPGVYIYKLQAGEFTSVKKMILVK